METTSDTYFVIRVKTYPKTSSNASENKAHVRYVVTRYSSETLTDRVEEATTFESSSIENLIRIYQNCLKRYAEGDVDYIKVSVNKIFEHIDLDKEEYLEERRRVALSKLSEDDVKALNVERLAVYNKLKYGEGNGIKPVVT
jgi:hypothetical protein